MKVLIDQLLVGDTLERFNGVKEYIYDDYSIFYIESLSDKIISLIHDNIVEICWGEVRGNSNLNMYSTSKVIKNFLSRLDRSEEDSKKKGYIGEFILHIIIRSYFYDYTIVNSFFNKEDQSLAKKGFDILLLDSNETVWITESKAGSVSSKQNVNEKISERISEAKHDLVKRLGPGHDDGIWNHAVSDVHASLKDNDQKRMVEQILDNSTELTNRNFKVVLGVIVFHDINEKFDGRRISDRLNSIVDAKDFKEIKIIAIQKSTYQKLIDVIREASEEIEQQTNHSKIEKY